MFQTKVVEEIKTHILCSITPPPPLKWRFNVIIWKNTVDPDWPQMTICRKRIACWTPKATNTHSEYVKRIVFPRQQWLRERV